MLKSLLIKNYAIIEHIQTEFEPGLNILTGETGAGKSIIIDALGLLLGDRASAEVVRRGADKCVVEGIFGVSGNSKIRSLLNTNDLEWQDDLILRREVSAKGQGRCFINDTPVSLAILKEAGDFLVDMHGQHEHQSLLRSETHIELLDDFGGLEGLLQEYRARYGALTGLFETLEELEEREQQLKDKRDLFEFQMKEIDAVSPRPDEEETLEAELRVLENAEKLFEATSRLYQTLYEGEQAIYDQLVVIRNQLEDLSGIDRSFEEPKSEMASAVAVVGEITKFVQQYNSRIEFNPERLEEIRTRLGQLSLLKKKYGGSIPSILEHRDRIGGEFALAENFESEIRKIRDLIRDRRKECSDAAQRLSAKRRDLAPRISSSIAAELGKLGIPNAQFEVRIDNAQIDHAPGRERKRVYVQMGRDAYEANSRGYDLVEFFVSTNAGEEPRPLTKVASGGEISRIMLALKSILAKSERLPLLIFDEIDVGVSGRIAQAVGKSLKDLSRFHQIVAITHLPQIAGLADTHYGVLKSEKGDRATTKIRKLSLEERVEEVAKLMSGTEVTEAGLEGARELMGVSGKNERPVQRIR